MSDRFRSGQSLDGALTAAFLNDLSTMLDQWKRSQGAAFTGATPSTGERSQTVIRVKNVSGDDVGRFAVMGLGDPVIDPGDGDAQLMHFKNMVALQGDEPDIEQHWGLFCITLTPIQDGRIGEAVVAGVVQCKVNVRDENHQWADIKDGDTTQLDSDDCGTCKILWKESGAGEGKWAYVLVGESSLAGFCVAQEDISPNVSGAIKFSSRGGAEFGDEDEGVWAAADDAGTILEGAVCFRSRIGQEWILSPVGCP